jgi:ADP-heptose:LPS heptosyltransferase
MRPDNMGDLIMSGPAIRALKHTFDARVTVLTSSMGKLVASFMDEIDETMVFDLPWIKSSEITDSGSIQYLVDALKLSRFDAAVIFTVYSQNPLPTAMLAYAAGIPKVLAYCRENPYGLLTHWVPDEEPHRFIRHQVRRDLDLVKVIGAASACESLCLRINDVWPKVARKLERSGAKLDRPWLILHAGVSEHKRQYPLDLWIGTGHKIIDELDFQIFLTGSSAEKQLTDRLRDKIGENSYSVAGMLDMEEFISLVQHSPLMISVNTGAVHIASAVGTPVVVLYAQTNPQHTPWRVPCKVLQFPVAEDVRSRNEVIQYVNRKLYNEIIDMPQPDDIIVAAKQLLNPIGSPDQQFHEIRHQIQEIVTS